MLNRESILAVALVTRTKPVNVPEWGVKEDGSPETVNVCSISADEAESVNEGLQGSGAQSVRWVIACTVDESGNRIFTNDDITALGKMPITVISRIANAAIDLNSFRNAETAVKN